MRCLYCGKELALLKRLTGGGEFCSDAHKQSYQEEYNRLALSRLLQAQAKVGESKGAPKKATPKVAPVAVAEPFEEPEAAQTAPVEEAPAIAQAPPPPEAIFAMDRPVFAPPPEGTSYVEPWLDAGSSPATPELQYQNGHFTLPAAQLVPLVVQPRPWQNEHPVSEAEVTPKEFFSTKIKLGMPFAVKPAAQEFPAAGPLTLDFPPRSSDLGRNPSLTEALAVRFPVEYRNSALLESAPTGIDFPAADAAVVVPDPWGDGFVATPVMDVTTVVEPAHEAGSPRAALEALSRLHLEIVEKHESPELREPELVPAGAQAEEVVRVGVLAGAPVSVVSEPTPRAVGEFLEIPLKSFPPPKTDLSAAAGAMTLLRQPVLPRLKTLPLRPKVALAPKGFAVPSAVAPAKSSVADTKAKSSVSAAAPRPETRPKPAAPPPPPPVPAAKRPAPKRPEPPPPKPNQPPASDEPTLTFETLQLQLMANSNAPFWSTLKFKVGAGLIALVLGSAAYFGFRGKPHAPAAAQAADIAGPSIMVGEGGWVQGWAGDTPGAHLGRQITMYRPSLKLSDYRIEFQGEIDAKSLGWVFRAADSDNYYAMKLAIVASGLNPKIALIKRVILNGHETDAGQVPVNIAARLDTVYTVRVDVRGPRFSTWVQGQPVDVWTDDQIKAGGVGFLNERAERARIKSVSISYLTGAK